MVNGQRSTVNSQWSMVNGQWSMVKETKRQREEETKSWGVNGQWSTVKETKRGRDKGRKDRLFETLMFMNLIH